MTEGEWQAGTDLSEMLWVARRSASPRKQRLFGCACCRAVWHLVTDPRGRRMVELAESCADGLVAWDVSMTVTDADFVTIRDDPPRGYASHAASTTLYWAPDHAAKQAAEYAALAAVSEWTAADPSAWSRASFGRVEAAQARLLQDIVGDPFRPVPFNPSWRTSTAVGLAERMYEVRDFSALPLLADALEDAGCDDTDILAHCRGERPHVRGCWVVDLVLGRE